MSLNGERMHDPDGKRRRAGVICVNYLGAEPSLLFISSRKRTGAWMLPAGGIEEGEAEGAAAVREVWEEAGATGSKLDHLCVLDSVDGAARTHYFTMTEVTLHDEYPEAKERMRKWVPFSQALAVIDDKCASAIRSYLDSLDHSVDTTSLRHNACTAGSTS